MAHRANNISKTKRISMLREKAVFQEPTDITGLLKTGQSFFFIFWASPF